jgi:hypothetical protein
MRSFRLLFFVGCLPVLCSSAQEQQPPVKAAAEAPAFTKDIRPLLKKYCFECHNETKRRGGLNLEKYDSDHGVLDLNDLWDQVGERVRGKEMPPVKAKLQPSDQDRNALLAWVKHVAESQVNCATLTPEQRDKALAGYTTSRRLNRFEYNNTLRDLFGVDLHAGDLLPSEGGGGEGFDNTGATLFTTPVLLEKYLEAAELVLGTLLPQPTINEGASPVNRVEAEQLAALRKKLLIAVPGPAMLPRDAARQVLASFVPRAFRRPAAAKEIDRYLAIFDKAHARDDSYELALKQALKGVLISPSFLFLIETPPETKGVYRLEAYELASHLSYFLWASMPDEELLQLAAKDQLRDDKVLRGQVKRMLRDGRSRALADGFATQWLGIRPLGGTIRPDAKMFPEFTEELAAAMRDETILFIDSIFRDDRSVLEVLSADYTFVNEPLAAHYKIDGVKGPQMRRVKLDDPLRGGVLGQASILTVTSFPHRTSPVLRGRWILEELLGTEVPPPPPDVPIINDRKKDGKGLSFRQQLEKHRSKAECASCHNRMDPLGFGLENFDALGRWRTDLAGQAIDNVGVLPSGEKFAGPLELKRLLLEKRRTEFVRNLSRKMLGYALGREVNRVDMCVVQGCVRALEQNEFRASQLMEAIVVSYPFSHRSNEK